MGSKFREFPGFLARTTRREGGSSPPPRTRKTPDFRGFFMPSTTRALFSTMRRQYFPRPSAMWTHSKHYGQHRKTIA